MKALHWDGEEITITDKPRPTIQPGESLVKVNCAGICNTDLEIMSGYTAFTGTLGHEFVGHVIESSDPTLINRRVVCDINKSCGHCQFCNELTPHHCLNRKTLGIREQEGAFTEYIACPTENLVQVPESIPDKQAVFAEPLAAALEILEQLSLPPRTEIAVLGDGKLGLLIAMALGHQGMQVHLIGRHQHKLDKASKFTKSLATELPTRQFPYVVEASGKAQGFTDALSLVQATGTLILKSTYADGINFNPATLVINEINLLGSRCGPMKKAVELLSEQSFSVEGLIDQIFTLDQASTAFKAARQKGALKILFKLEPERG